MQHTKVFITHTHTNCDISKENFFTHQLMNNDDKGNETKSKMKQPPDVPTLRFEHGW